MSRNPVSPQNETQSDFHQILVRLSSGEYLGELDKYGIIKPVYSEALTQVNEAIRLSRAEGSISQRFTVWLSAPRGGGKTEALSAIEKEVVTERPIDHYKKSLVVPIDLMDLREIYPTFTELQLAVFWKSIMTASSHWKSNIDLIVQKLLSKTPAQQIHENLIGLGFDVAFTLVNLPVPGLSSGISWLFSQIHQSIKLSEANIRRILRQNDIFSEDTTSLLMKWIKYSVKPSNDTWNALSKTSERFAREGILFSIFCNLLELSGYSTIVFLVDEVDEARWDSALTHSFELFWNPSKEADIYKNRINMIFVFASTEITIEKLNNNELHGGFPRRFLGPVTDQNRIVILRKPVVKENDDSNDDLAHALEKVRELARRLNRVVVAPEAEIALRGKLAILSKDGLLTWHGLWAAVCKIYYPGVN